MALTLWHNPRCSKSRQALKLLEEAGQEPTLRLYLVEQPTLEELKDILEMLNKSPSEIIRKSEKIFKEKTLKTATEAELFDAMIADPILIERPIAVNQDRAVIGRPPEDVLTII